MLWLLTIPVIVYLTFREILSYRRTYSFLEWCCDIFFSCLTSALIALVPLSFAVGIGVLPEIVGEKDQVYDLVVLRDKDGFSGQSYFLSIGSIRDTQYYFWYRREADGHIVGGKTKRDPCMRLYETTQTPHMVTFKTAYVNPALSSWFWLIGIDPRGSTQWCSDFYIPKGAIKEGFMLE